MVTKFISNGKGIKSYCYWKSNTLSKVPFVVILSRVKIFVVNNLGILMTLYSSPCRMASIYLISDKLVGVMFRRLKYFVSQKFHRTETINHFSSTKTFSRL